MLFNLWTRLSFVQENSRDTEIEMREQLDLAKSQKAQVKPAALYPLINLDSLGWHLYIPALQQ